MSLSLVTSYAPVKGKSTSPDLATASVTASIGDYIIVLIGWNSASGGINISEATWGSMTMTADDLHLDPGFNDGTNAVTSMFGAATEAGTQTLTVSFDGNVTGVAQVVVWSGINAGAFDVAGFDSGSGTTPSTIATDPIAQASELQVAAVITAGPVEDTAGTWGNSLTGDKRDGTTGGVAGTNRTLSTAYRELSAIAAVTASKSGITSRTWMAYTATFKIAAAAGTLIQPARMSVGMGIGTGL